MEEHEESGKEDEMPKIYDQYKHKNGIHKGLDDQKDIIVKGCHSHIVLLSSMAML